MANQLYPKFKEALLTAGLDVEADNIKAILTDTADYTFSTAHDFLDDVTATAREETSGNFASKTITDGVFDAAGVVFTGTAGDGCEAVIIYKDSGVASSSNLMVYIDTAGGLPVTLGGDVTVRWNASGIFALQRSAARIGCVRRMDGMLLRKICRTEGVDGGIAWAVEAEAVTLEGDEGLGLLVKGTAKRPGKPAVFSRDLIPCELLADPIALMRRGADQVAAPHANVLRSKLIEAA